MDSTRTSLPLDPQNHPCIWICRYTRMLYPQRPMLLDPLILPMLIIMPRPPMLLNMLRPSMLLNPPGLQSPWIHRPPMQLYLIRPSMWLVPPAESGENSHADGSIRIIHVDGFAETYNVARSPISMAYHATGSAKTTHATGLTKTHPSPWPKETTNGAGSTENTHVPAPPKQTMSLEP